MIASYQINAIAFKSFLDRNPWLQATLGALGEEVAQAEV